jgi:hypothetical protein
MQNQKYSGFLIFPTKNFDLVHKKAKELFGERTSKKITTDWEEDNLFSIFFESNIITDEDTSKLEELKKFNSLININDELTCFYIFLNQEENEIVEGKKVEASFGFMKKDEKWFGINKIYREVEFKSITHSNSFKSLHEELSSRKKDLRNIILSPLPYFSCDIK